MIFLVKTMFVVITENDKEYFYSSGRWICRSSYRYNDLGSVANYIISKRLYEKAISLGYIFPQYKQISTEKRKVKSKPSRKKKSGGFTPLF